MGFSGIGIWEILLILIVALIVLGPRRVPEIARKLGQVVRAVRKASNDLSTAITREIDVTQDNPSSAQPKENSSSITSNINTKSQDDQPETPGGASSAQ